MMTCFAPFRILFLAAFYEVLLRFSGEDELLAAIATTENPGFESGGHDSLLVLLQSIVLLLDCTGGGPVRSNPTVTPSNVPVFSLC